MQVYNVDVYNLAMELVYHDTIDAEAVEYEYDYISPVSNEVILNYNDKVAINQYIYIYPTFADRDKSYFGVIDGVEKINEEKQIKVNYADFVSTLNENFLFRADLLQNDDAEDSTPLEECIGDIIWENYIANYDTLQNKKIISTSVTYTTNDTKDWTIGAEPDVASGMIIQNIYDDLLVQAFKRYGIVVTATFSQRDLKVYLTIGKFIHQSWDGYTQNIELDLPNVLDKEVIIRKQNKPQTNKLEIYNKTQNYETLITYYLHPNGTYNTTNSNRITPVVLETAEVTVSSNTTFAKEAKKKAAAVFNSIEYDNLIELEVLNDDTLVKPYHIQVGQTINVIYKGVVYNSILSGYKRSKTTTLTFGSIRLALTKILKQEGIR